MIIPDLTNLGLIDFDTKELQTNPDCAIFIDRNQRKILPIQPDDEFLILKYRCTEEALRNHLGQINRTPLFDRIITTHEIRLDNLTKLSQSVENKKEALIDYIIATNQDPSMQELPTEVKKTIEERKLRCFEENYSMAAIYYVIRAIDLNLSKQLLPLIKSHIHQYMMLPDEFPHRELNRQFDEKTRILMTPAENEQQEDSQRKCIASLSLLQSIWSDQPEDEWNKISVIPRSPFTPKHKWKKQLEEDMETLAKERKKTREEIDVLTKLNTETAEGQQELKEKTKGRTEQQLSEEELKSQIRLEKLKIREMDELREQLDERIEEELEQQEMTESTRLVEESLEEVQGVMEESKRLEKKLKQIKKENEQDRIIRDTMRTFLSDMKKQSKTPSRSRPHAYREPPPYDSQHITEQQAGAAKERYKDTAYSESTPESRPLPISAIPFEKSQDAHSAPLTTGVGARQKTRTPQKTEPTSDLQHVTKIKDQDTLKRRLIEKCQQAHDEYSLRQQDVENYIKDPTEKNKEKALKAVSSGFWVARELDKKLVRAGYILNREYDSRDNPFLELHTQLFEGDAFKYGCLPYADDAKKIPFFKRQMTEDAKWTFVLDEGQLPSRALKSCKSQLVLMDSTCFLQTILYEIVEEALDNTEIFDWHFQQRTTRLELTPIDAHFRLYNFNPMFKLLSKQSSSRMQTGHITTWFNVGETDDETYVDKYNVLHAVCTQKRKRMYTHTIPGLLKDATSDNIEAKLMANLTAKARTKVPRQLSDAGCGERKDFRKSLDLTNINKIRNSFRDAQRQFQESTSEPMPLKPPRQRTKKKHRDPSEHSSSPPSLSGKETSASSVADVMTDQPKPLEQSIDSLKTRLTACRKKFQIDRTKENRLALKDAVFHLEKEVKVLEKTDTLNIDTITVLLGRSTAAIKKANEVLKERNEENQ